jgi:long-subunit fatty acid transport protein
VNIQGIVTQAGSQPVITNAVVPYHLRDTWLFTLGSHYRVTPQWILRVAGSYNQSAGNTNYQVTNGDSIVLGASTGYQINKNIVVDGSYAHAFIQNANIHINTGRNMINGVNEASLNSVSLKLTVNL